MESRNHRPFHKKAWVWILFIEILMLGVVLLPGTLDRIHRSDIAIARALNSLLGHNETFDRAIGTLNSRRGDMIIILGLAMIASLHAWRGRGRDERYQRTVFWIWTILLFVIVYRAQSAMEGIIPRESPASELHRWRNLVKMYDIPARVYHRHSFPSGHATAYFFMAFMTWRIYPRICALFLMLGLLLPTTRIITGAHWPSDILLGSIPIALLVVALIRETPIRHTRRFVDKACRRLLNRPRQPIPPEPHNT